MDGHGVFVGRLGHRLEIDRQPRRPARRGRSTRARTDARTGTGLRQFADVPDGVFGEHAHPRALQPLRPEEVGAVDVEVDVVAQHPLPRGGV